MPKKSIWLLSLSISWFMSYAQNVPTKILQGMGEIIHSDEVRGYYYFSKLEKTGDGRINYELSLVDENLQPINSVNISRPKNFTLVESVYNERNFAFLFFDKSTKRLEIIAYDSTLHEVASIKKNIRNSLELSILTGISKGKQPDDPFMIGLKESGFINYGFKEGSSPFYEITCFDNDLKVKWTAIAPEEKKYAYISASEAFHTNQYIGSLVTRVKNRRTEYSLLVHDRETGEEIINKELIRNGVSLSPSNFTYDSINQKIVVFGEYYDVDDKEVKDQSKGFAYFVIAMNGEFSMGKTLPWSYLSTVAPVKENGKTDGSNTFIYFHDFVRTADGRTFAIGEQYKKIFNGAGIAVAVLTLGSAYTSSVHINVYNLVMFQFSPDYNLEKVHFFEKNKSGTILPVGSMTTSAKALANYVRAVGGFDYAFSHQSVDKETFSAIYVDFDRSNTGSLQVGTVTFTPEKTFVADKITLPNRSKLVKVMRAKPGYIYIMSYLKGEKKLDVRLEKVNY
jgi:hypothetical protein